MDRHVEFATQLSHLVALYAHDPLDRAAEKASLRAARRAAKHGAIALTLVGGQLRAGQQDANTDAPDVAALQVLLTALGVVRIELPHQAKQDEIKRLAKLLGDVAAGRAAPLTFPDALAAEEWQEVKVACARVPVRDAREEPAAGEQAVVETSGAEHPTEQEAGGVGPDEALPETATVEAPVEAPVGASAEDSEALETAPEVLALEEAALPAEPSKPLAEKLPAVVEEMAGPAYRELFERLITASEPWTLRRLLEPVQSAIEQTAREGTVATSARLVVAMFACEACAEDPEMRRQFVVMLRRLTKPTLIRAYAALYGDAPESQTELEQVLARFGEDGSEAVADCIGSAPNREVRTLYTELLARLPGTNDALLAMLDDDRELVVERAIELIVELRHPETERVLGEQLGEEKLRVREAAARGLATLADSAFAADALGRALRDAAPEVRLAAAVGLQSRREERVVPTLLPLLDTEEELDVQLALVATLGKIVTTEGVQKLIALANPSERMMRRRRMPVLRLSAIEAMGEARTPAAMAALQRLLEDKEKDVREAAARLYTRARRQTAAMSASATTDP